MAKRKGGQRDRFINRYRGRLTVPADSTTAVVETFNTGMNVGRGDPTKWVITHFFWQPGSTAGSSPFTAPWVASQQLTCQLAIGTQTGLLASDDMQLIAESKLGTTFGTDGAGVWFWPAYAPIPSPLPVYAQALSIIFDAAVNNANIASKEIAYEIGYWVAPVASDEILEHLSAFGQV